MKNLITLFVFFGLLFFTSKKNNSSNIVKNKRSLKGAEIIDAVKPALDSQAISQLDSLFFSLHKTRNFNGAVLIAKNGTVIYDTVIGYANVKQRTPLQKNGVFQLASVSKQFTAYGILLLQKRGLLSISDSVDKYIEGFPYPGVTVKMLLTHTSGLPNYLYFYDKYKSVNEAYLTNQRVVDIMLTHKPAPYLKPNEKYNYCNTNYVLLAYLIEQLSKQTYAEFMKTQVFEPLGMKNTYVWQPELVCNDLVCGNVSTKKIAENDCFDGATGDKGVLATTNDLLLWDQALYSSTLLSADDLKDAFENQNQHMKHKKSKYGYGWRIADDAAGNKIVWHAGWWHGFNTYIGRRPSDKTCVIILSNISNRSFFTSKYKVWDIIDAKISVTDGDLAFENEE